jgi:hypothetical protein
MSAALQMSNDDLGRHVEKTVGLIGQHLADLRPYIETSLAVV